MYESKTLSNAVTKKNRRWSDENEGGGVKLWHRLAHSRSSWKDLVKALSICELATTVEADNDDDR